MRGQQALGLTMRGQQALGLILLKIQMKYIPVENFNLGGIAESKYQGQKNSVASLSGFDLHSEAGILKLNQKLKKDSSSTIDDLVKVMVQASDGHLYMFGSTNGKVWKRDSSDGTYSLLGTASPASGNAGILDAREFEGYIYYAMESRLGRWEIGSDFSTRADSYATFTNTDDTYHPMQVLNGVLYIGDGFYISQVDNAHLFVADALDIETKYRVSALGKYDTDLLIGTKVDDKITKTMVLRWNGWSVSWSMDDTIEEEGINAFINGDNYVIVSAGKSGNLYYYDGARLDLLRHISGEYEIGDEVVVHSNAQDNLKGLPLFALSDITGSPVACGVYSYGSRLRGYPKVLNFEYELSEGVTDGIEIGTLLVVGDTIFVSWKHGTSYGIDTIDSSAKVAEAVLETRVMNPTGFIQNKYQEVLVEYVSYPTGTDIDIEYKVNHASSWTVMNGVKDAKRNIVRATGGVMGGDFEIKLTAKSSGNNAPEIKRIFIGFE